MTRSSTEGVFFQEAPGVDNTPAPVVPLTQEASMNLIKTRPGVIINLDQVWMIEINPDRILFHSIGEKRHDLEKKHLPEGEWDTIKKQIEGKAV